jgi:hypothetical protein
MKNIIMIGLLALSSTAFADTFSNATIDSVMLDKSMHLMMTIKMSPCDEVALPQLVRDEKNPTVFTVQAVARKTNNDACISMITEKPQVVSLPALMEVASAKLSKLVMYTFKFEGIDTTLIVPGQSLMTSIQPDFQAE